MRPSLIGIVTALSLAACSSRPAAPDPTPPPTAATEPDRTPPPIGQLVKAPAQSSGEAEKLLRRGQARLEEARQAAGKGRDFEALAKAAIQDFDEAVKADARSAGARAGRGEARAALTASRMPGGDFTGRGDLETAIADYTEAIRLEPDRAAYYAGRAFARQKLAVARFFARIAVGELFGAAMKDIDEAIKRESSNALYHRQKAEAMYEVGVYALYRGDPPLDWYAGAVKEYEETARLEPGQGPIIEAGLKTCRDRAGGAPATTPEPGIVWAKTFELGQREAQVRRVPICFYVSGGAG